MHNRVDRSSRRCGVDVRRLSAPRKWSADSGCDCSAHVPVPQTSPPCRRSLPVLHRPAVCLRARPRKAVKVRGGDAIVCHPVVSDTNILVHVKRGSAAAGRAPRGVEFAALGWRNDARLVAPKNRVTLVCGSALGSRCRSTWKANAAVAPLHVRHQRRDPLYTYLSAGSPPQLSRSITSAGASWTSRIAVSDGGAGPVAMRRRCDPRMTTPAPWTRVTSETPWSMATPSRRRRHSTTTSRQTLSNPSTERAGWRASRDPHDPGSATGSDSRETTDPHRPSAGEPLPSPTRRFPHETGGGALTRSVGQARCGSPVTGGLSGLI